MWNFLMVRVDRKNEILPLSYAFMEYRHFQNNEGKISFQCIFAIVKDWTIENDIESSSESIEEVMNDFMYWFEHTLQSYWKDCDVVISDEVCINIYNKTLQENGGNDYGGI